jgi:hypothetical protein
MPLLKAVRIDDKKIISSPEFPLGQEDIAQREMVKQ